MSLRRTFAVAATALLLSSGLIASTPTTAAAPDYDIDNPKTWGATRAPDQVLRRGCHRYRYHYRIDVPDWAAEVILVNPNGVKLAHDVLFHVTEPRRGWRRWSTEICRASTTYGKHRILMKITWDPDKGSDPTPDNIDGWTKTSSFRMKRP